LKAIASLKAKGSYMWNPGVVETMQEKGTTPGPYPRGRVSEVGVSKADWNKVKKRVSVLGTRKAVRMSRLPKSVKLVGTARADPKSLGEVADLTEINEPRGHNIPAVLNAGAAHRGPPVAHVAVQLRGRDDEGAN
jgi:hypothetical protein